MKNNPLNTSLRSDTHATDSTCKGWMANSAATKAPGQNVPVSRRNKRNSSTAFAACRITLVRCGPDRTGAKPLRVEHEGQPRQRMPVGGVTELESPFRIIPSQPGQYMRIGSEIILVIEIDELKPERLAEDCKYQRHQQKAHNQNRALVIGVRRALLWWAGDHVQGEKLNRRWQIYQRLLE